MSVYNSNSSNKITKVDVNSSIGNNEIKPSNILPGRLINKYIINSIRSSSSCNHNRKTPIAQKVSIVSPGVQLPVINEKRINRSGKVNRKNFEVEKIDRFMKEFYRKKELQEGKKRPVSCYEQNLNQNKMLYNQFYNKQGIYKRIQSGIVDSQSHNFSKDGPSYVPFNDNFRYQQVLEKPKVRRMNEQSVEIAFNPINMINVSKSANMPDLAHNYKQNNRRPL